MGGGRVAGQLGRVGEGRRVREGAEATRYALRATLGKGGKGG